MMLLYKSSINSLIFLEWLSSGSSSRLKGGVSPLSRFWLFSSLMSKLGLLFVRLDSNLEVVVGLGVKVGGAVFRSCAIKRME